MAGFTNMEKFWESQQNLIRQRFRLFAVLGAVLVPLFSLVDYFYYPQHWWDFLLIRTFITLYCVIILIIDRGRPDARFISWAGIIGYYLTGASIIWMIVATEGALSQYYAGLLLVFVGLCTVIPLDTWRIAFHVGALYLLFVAAVFLAGNCNHYRLCVINNVFMVATTLVLLIAVHSNFKTRVRAYNYRRELDRTSAKLHQYTDLLESRVAESEANYATLVNNADEAIFVLEDDVITFPNPSTAKLLGHDTRELGCFNFVDFVIPDHRQQVLDAYLEVAGWNKTITLDAIKISRADNDIRVIMLTIVPVEWRGRKALLHFARDITERQKLEAELLQAQKMEAIGTLAGGVAHDFNNVLQIITGYIQLLEIRQLCNDDGQRLVRNIKKAVDRASNITRQLLMYSRKTDFNPVPIDVNEHIVTVCRLLERTIPRMISINLHLQGDLKRIEAEPIQFEQVIMNLAVNARDAMPDGGRLDISTENIHVDESMARKHAGLETGDYVLLKVSDTGTGMDEQTLRRIFEPFFSTKEEGKGTGLGLAMVYGIITKHGGAIYCSSTPGQGTTFSIFLPVYQEQATENLSAKTETSDPALSDQEAGLILIVDDEAGILEIEKEMLVMHNYKVLTAGSGEEALEIFRKHGAEIRLVILDINMPGMGGYNCLIELKKLNPSLDVIIATGYAEEQHVKKVKEAGVSDIIKKPFKIDDLIPRIRAILGQGRQETGSQHPGTSPETSR